MSDQQLTIPTDAAVVQQPEKKKLTPLQAIFEGEGAKSKFKEVLSRPCCKSYTVVRHWQTPIP
jgi:hypothetical protein